MANSAWIDAAGIGETDFNGGVAIRPLVVVIELASLTNPKVRQFGSTFPVRLSFAGLIGFTTPDHRRDDSQVGAIGPWHRLDWEFEEWQARLETVDEFLSSVIFWRLPINIGFNLRVFW